MTLLILILCLILSLFIIAVIIKKIKKNKIFLGLILLLQIALIIFLYKEIPTKLDDVIKKEMVTVEFFNQKPSIEKIVTITVDESKNYILLKANDDLYNIGFYLIEAKDDTFVENSIIAETDKVFKDENLIIQAYVPDVVPNLKIKWTTKSGLKGELIVSRNGNSVNEYNVATYKHTIESFMKALLN